MNQVAVKVLHSDLAESVGAERFLREIRLTSGLDHPSIVPVTDSGADGNALYCVLPYMTGGTLRDLLREKKQLPIAEALDIGCTISNALAYAHARGLIHRDIKPENILFHNGKAYLGDFGIARALYATAGDLTTTTTGVIRGTPAYMSPEQASGERNYDGRSDIYSLGCVVYEMISGMAPFVGPTSQSVMAQRFSTTPRPMRSYRKSVSSELERVVETALAMVPADRFAKAEEFSAALEAAGKVPARRKIDFRMAAVGLVAAGVLVAAGIYAGKSGFVDSAPIAPDTTQLVVLPFDRDTASQPLGSVDPLVYDAFSVLHGLTVLEPFQVRDAIARNSRVSGAERDRSVSVALGAGRFVRGQVVTMPGGDGWKVYAWLHQVKARGDTTLFKASVTINRADLGSIDLQYAALARTLLLRGGEGDPVSSVVATKSLPAMQFFGKGMDAVAEWNFPVADSMLAAAIASDPQYGRAYVWQAQVRFWQRSGPETWAPLAMKALLDTTRLPERDIQLARGLAALGEKDYDKACQEYDALRKKNDADFAAWFGLARCRDLDFRVVRDAKSPTGWRYLSSYSDAVDAYEHAFTVLSLSHRSLERGAFEPLRELLFMRPSKLQAAVLPPGETGTLTGRLDWENNKPILRPVPMALLAAGDPQAVPAGMKKAIESQRRLFARIAASWSAALPTSAGAKEGVAVAFEMRGDRSALDTLRAARSLATDEDAKIRLAAAEAVLRLKFANPAHAADFVGVRRLADSLLTAIPNPTARQATYLAPLAVLLERCEILGRMVELSPFSNPRGVARDALGAVDALTVRTMLGCTTNPAAEIRHLEKLMEASTGDRAAIKSVLTRAVQSMAASDTAITSAFAVNGPYLIRAQQAVYRGRVDSVRAIMARLTAARERTGYDDVAPDAIYLEARVELATGDSAAAQRSLATLFDRLPYLTPGMLNRPVEMAGLMRAMELSGSAQWRRARQTLSSPRH